MLGKYEIVTKLAMGGMAEIYLARLSGTAGFEKMVVIKRILPTVANDPKFVQMFLDEARLAATLRHPNIADVYEAGEHQGAPFFTMEFVHGQDARSLRIAARKQRTPVPLSIALAIVHGMASALDYAHERTGPDGVNLGLVHRDVSSSNVLISYQGAIKLIDFGIARATSNDAKTKTGTLKGKIPYMSPEQCRGMPLDRRSDLFSLGVVFYELTAGRRPFIGDTDFAIMDQIVYQGAKPPSQVLRGYPPELENIVMRLLAHRPEDRYQSADDMLQDLEPFIAGHRLFVTPKQLSRYMRSLFDEQIQAWDAAIEEGNTVHFSRPSNPSADIRMTPVSSFPVIAPLSEQMAAVESGPIAVPGEIPTQASGPVRANPTPLSMPIIAPPVAPRASEQTGPMMPFAPDTNVRRRGWIVLVLVLFAIVFVSGGYIAYRVIGAPPPDDVAEPAPSTTPPITRPTSAPIAPAAATVTPPLVAQPDTEDTTDPEDTADPKDTADPEDTDNRDGSAAAKVPEKPAGAVATGSAAPVAHPVVNRPVRRWRRPVRPVAKVTPVKPKSDKPKDPATKTDPKDPKKDPKKDPTWKTGDSPFLP